MLEQWIIWRPLNNLLPKYDILSIFDTVEGFQLVLNDPSDLKHKILIFFESSIHAYRSTDESFRLRTLDMLDKTYGSSFYTQWTFFKVQNSSYFLWLSEQSYKIAKEEHLTHFSFLASNSIVDVIAAYEPIVKIL